MKNGPCDNCGGDGTQIAALDGRFCRNCLNEEIRKLQNALFDARLKALRLKTELKEAKQEPLPLISADKEA